ncbi:hypothetical protein [Pseudonocardia sp.]|uniref:hypothetical protein n=1 Tax=Pseudonocardia sp. TaxID=60912 RepID=UPI00261008A1|nr:hypothetical protein [Pseudonocardia sp.]
MQQETRATPGPAVRSWLTGSDLAQAETDLLDLVVWLERVYLRYPSAVLPSCWLWHPAVIEELWWLRNAHADAYHPATGSWARAGDWHDRLRPGVVKRLQPIATRCELALHVAGAEHNRGPALVPFAETAALIAQAWTRSTTTPEPTEHQLDQALKRDDQRNRTSTP